MRLKRGLYILFLMMFLLTPVILADSFNIDVEIPESYKEVSAGEELWYTTRVVNLGSEKRIDITLNYKVIGKHGNVAASKSETVALDTTASFVGQIALPKQLSTGKYILKVSLAPIGSSEILSRGETSFDVVRLDEHKKVEFTIYYIFAGLILIAAIYYGIKKTKPLLDKIKVKHKVDKIVKKKIK